MDKESFSLVAGLLMGWWFMPLAWQLLRSYRPVNRVAFALGMNELHDRRAADRARSFVLLALEQSYPEEIRRMKGELGTRPPEGFGDIRINSFRNTPHPSNHLDYKEWEQQRNVGGLAGLGDY